MTASVQDGSLGKVILILTSRMSNGPYLTYYKSKDFKLHTL